LKENETQDDLTFEKQTIVILPIADSLALNQILGFTTISIACVFLVVLAHPTLLACHGNLLSI
jgi:hypothetical protein